MPKITPIYDQECPVTQVMEIISKRWVFFILRAIRNDIHRFNGIKHALGSRVSNRTLSNLLSELIALGLIHKEPVGRYAHYRFTAKGASIMRILDDTCDWAARFSGLPHA